MYFSKRNFICCLLLLLQVACSSVFYYPTQHLPITPAYLGLSFEERYILSDGLKLHGWYLPAQGEKKGSVLFLHGNAQNIGNHLPSVAWLPHEGIEVYLYDYRGYGKSAGRPSPKGIAEDVRRMINAVYEETNNCVVLFGQSLGAALALFAASEAEIKDKICAVIADSPFADYRKIVREKLRLLWLTYPLSYPLSFLVNNQFSPLAQIDKVCPIPILFIHGAEDQTVSAENTKLLYRAAKEPKEKWIVPGYDHIEVLRDKRFQRKLVAYLRFVPLPPKR